MASSEQDIMRKAGMYDHYHIPMISTVHICEEMAVYFVICKNNVYNGLGINKINFIINWN